MSRVSMFNSPLLLGFDQLERTLDRLAKSAEGYPPYNIERIGENGLRIVLAVAGFTSDDLVIELVENSSRSAASRATTPSVSSSIAASPRASSSGRSCWPTGSK
jgi:HSP20 family molecular chaperone IbpA